MSVCKCCKLRGKTWSGSDPKCAFTTGAFGENWNCATVGLIRDICEKYGEESPKRGVDYQYCEDQKYCTIKVDNVQDIEDDPLALWVTWYKRRGGTDQMWLLFHDKPPRVPTERECLIIATAYGFITEDTP